MPMPRGWGAKFYTSGGWIECRLSYMNHVHWTCEVCGEPAEILHHINSITQTNCSDPDVLYGWDNLQAVCRKCHEVEHEVFRGRRNKIDSKLTVNDDGTVEGKERKIEEVLSGLIL